MDEKAREISQAQETPWDETDMQSLVDLVDPSPDEPVVYVFGRRRFIERDPYAP